MSFVQSKYSVVSVECAPHIIQFILVHLRLSRLYCGVELSDHSAVLRLRSYAVFVTGRNCGQCKKIFGHYFEGQVCVELSLTTNGKVLPDCNNPNTLRGLLKRLH